MLEDPEEIIVEFPRMAGPTPPSQVYLGILQCAKTVIMITIATKVSITIIAKGGSQVQKSTDLAIRQTRV